MEDPAARPEARVSKRLLTWMHIPVISFFTFWWLSSPTADAIEKILNIIGIVDALMLTLVVGIAGTVSYDEMRAADDRFVNAQDTSVPDAEPYRKAWFSSELGLVGIYNVSHAEPASIPADYITSYGKTPSEYLISNVLLSTFFYTASLLTVVMLYMYLTIADIDKTSDDDDGSEETSNKNKKAMAELQEWYKYNMWPMATCILMFIVGTILFFRANWYLVMIKAPDYRLLDNNGWTWGGVYTMPAILGISIAALLVFTCIICGWSLYGVLALNYYGVPQPASHVVFFMKPRLPASPEEIVGGTRGNSKIVPYDDSAKVAAAVKTDKAVVPSGSGKFASGTSAGGVEAKLAGVALAAETLAREVQALAAQLAALQGAAALTGGAPVAAGGGANVRGHAFVSDDGDM